MGLRTDLPILIVGQGISGSILALQSKKRGIAFRIMDDGHRSASSLAAAGLYNPFIFKRRKLSWKGAEFFPVCKKFFTEVHEVIGATVDHEIGIARRVHDIAELNDWTANEGEPYVSQFLGDAISKNEVSPLIDAPLGYRAVPKAGYVDTHAFLASSKKTFQESGDFIAGSFDESEVDQAETLSYRGESYAAIVICTGYRSREPSRFFPKLPFTPAKGHTLIIRCSQLDLSTIVSGPCFILPLGDGKFRIGATFSWSNLNEEVEEKEVEKLIQNFRSFCTLPFEIIDSKAGVRPATKDRKPLIGASKLDARVQLFGGMGSRAIMCAPLLSEMFLDHLFKESNLWPEVDVNRFEG